AVAEIVEHVLLHEVVVATRSATEHAPVAMLDVVVLDGAVIAVKFNAGVTPRLLEVAVANLHTSHATVDQDARAGGEAAGREPLAADDLVVSRNDLRGLVGEARDPGARKRARTDLQIRADRGA